MDAQKTHPVEARPAAVGQRDPHGDSDLRVLWLNLAVDADDPVLGFASGWLAEVARRVDRVEAITMIGGRLDLPDNVRVTSIGKERGYSEPRRAVEFYRALVSAVRRLRPHVCFSHMAPIFSVMAAPVLRPLGVPIVTWYAHPKVTPTLRAAHTVSHRMVTSAPGAYRYKHDKLTVLSQGIDEARFPPAPPAEGPPYELVSVGRLSPVKDPMTMVRAVGTLRDGGIDARLTLVGEAPAGQEHFAARLRAEIGRLGLSEHVDMPGACTNAEAGARHRAAFAHLNAAPADHSLDKAVLEALFSGRPSLTSTDGFAATFGPAADLLLFPEGDADALAQRVATLVAMPDEERASLSTDARSRAIAMHGLSGLADSIVDLLKAQAHA